MMIRMPLIVLLGGLFWQSWSTNLPVNIQNFAFAPQNAIIQAGDSVTWINLDNTTHSVTSTSTTGASWNSGTLEPGERFTRQFEEPGTYTYAGKVGSMTGTVNVNPSTGIGRLPDRIGAARVLGAALDAAASRIVLRVESRSPASAEIELLDAAGRLVARDARPLAEGVQELSFQCGSGRLESGVYFARLRLGQESVAIPVAAW